MLLASGFSVFGNLIQTTKNCITPKPLSEETIKVFRDENPVRIVKCFLWCEFLDSAIVWVNNPSKTYINWPSMRLRIEKKVIRETSWPSWEVLESFSRILQMDQWLFVSNSNKRVSSTGKSRQIRVFYLYVYKHFFFLKTLSSYIKPVCYCKLQFSTSNHTIALLWKR